MVNGTPRVYRFDGYCVDLVRRLVILSDSSRPALSSRAYDVLVYLIEHRDGVVSKDDLMTAVWPGMVVEDNNISQAISSLRRILGDQRGAPRFIATVAGRGYRFVADVTAEPTVSEPLSQEPVDSHGRSPREERPSMRVHTQRVFGSA